MATDEGRVMEAGGDDGLAGAAESPLARDREDGPLARIGELADFRFLLRSFLSFSEERAELAGVTAQQYQLLQVVATQAADGASITVLAQRMLLRHNSAVELVDRAERGGLVRRRGDTRDQRRSLVEMTEKGYALLSGLVAEHVAYLEQSGPAMIAALRVVTGAEE